MTGEEWPGFNTPLIRNPDSLWDKEYNPMEHNAWTTSTEGTTGPNVSINSAKIHYIHVSDLSIAPRFTDC